MDPFLAEIRIFPFNFPPAGWAFCDGQLIPISQNTALFSLLGTVYGGDGKSTFALPDLQGAAVMQPGQGQGLSNRELGQMGGVESITLLQSEIPVHTHSIVADNLDNGDNSVPAPDKAVAMSTGGALFSTSLSQGSQMAFQGLPPAGGGLPHNNMQPYLTLNYCIRIDGNGAVFPQRP